MRQLFDNPDVIESIESTVSSKDYRAMLTSPEFEQWLQRQLDHVLQTGVLLDFEFPSFAKAFFPWFSDASNDETPPSTTITKPTPDGKKTYDHYKILTSTYDDDDEEEEEEGNYVYKAKYK
jgi:hypothetical protein